VSKELDPDFNILKIHLMSLWVEQIRQVGALQKYSAKNHKQACTTNLKDSGIASSHILNSLLQVITSQRSILYLDFTELNLQAVAECRENSAAAI
jgi:hypothetical protein